MIELKDLLLSRESINYAISKLDFTLGNTVLNLHLNHVFVSINLDTNELLIQTNTDTIFECFNKKRALNCNNYLNIKTLVDNFSLKMLYNKALKLNSDIENMIYKAFN